MTIFLSSLFSSDVPLFYCPKLWRLHWFLCRKVLVVNDKCIQLKIPWAKICICFFCQTSIPVPSPGAGIIEELLVEDGSKVVAGQELFKLRLTDAAVAPG